MDPVKTMQNKDVKVQGIRINNLKFKDNINLLKESNSGLEDLLKVKETACI